MIVRGNVFFGLLGFAFGCVLMLRWPSLCGRGNDIKVDNIPSAVREPAFIQGPAPPAVPTPEAVPPVAKAVPPAGKAAAPAGGGVSNQIRVGVSCDQAVTKDGYFYKEKDFAKDDEDWGKKSCPVREMTNMDEFYDFVETPRIQCEVPVMVGGGLRRNDKVPVLDGGKWVCMTEKFNVKPMHCRVMSFGISQEWSFDDEMDKKYECKVYCFDHTNGKPDHNRSANIQFFSMGLSGFTRTAPNGRITIDRYANILERLKLNTSIIDYVKIDIEGHERPFLDDVLTKTPNLLKNIKMLGIEIHNEAKGAFQNLWPLFQKLECLGFKLIFSEKNRVRGLWFRSGNKIRSRCYELVFARDKQW